MTTTTNLDASSLKTWTTDDGPIALVLRRQLLPVEGKGAVLFPPTFSDIGYSIDILKDGRSVALIDSVGSQANRLEPLFNQNTYSDLIPKIVIQVPAEQGEVSLLDVGHRLGDALVRSSTLAPEAQQAFLALKRGDAGPLAKIAPTSLVFGAWDSRDTQAKVPRLLSSTIRAWDVEKLHRAAQYNPAVDYVNDGLMKESSDKKENDARSAQGFRHVPAVWIDDKASNREQILGGIVAHGEIVQEISLNLNALRRLSSPGHPDLQNYILGLCLVAATVEPDGDLRQGCLLTPDPDFPAQWELVHRNGQREAVSLSHDLATQFAKQAAAGFGVESPEEKYAFDPKLAEKLVSDQKKKKG